MKRQFSASCSTAAALILLLGLSGCLTMRSREDEEKDRQSKQQVSTLQQTSVDHESRLSDVDAELRKNSGRIEALEVRMTGIREKAEKNDLALEAAIKSQGEKVEVLKEEISRLTTESADLKARLEKLESKKSGKGGAESGSKKPTFDVADEKFAAKNWRESILAFEEYRKTYPKGSKFALATLKIGIAFEELGLKDDAKVFFEEVVSRFPNSKEAEKARGRLASPKKK